MSGGFSNASTLGEGRRNPTRIGPLADYLEQRHRLMIAWEFRPHLIAELELYEQHALHDFFAMSREMYDDDAVTHRQNMTKLEPSLPHKAGRAYGHFEQVVAADRERRAVVQNVVETVPVRGAKRLKKTVRVTALVTSELDVQGLARAIMNLAKEDQKNGGELLKRLKK